MKKTLMLLVFMLSFIMLFAANEVETNLISSVGEITNLEYTPTITYEDQYYSTPPSVRVLKGQEYDIFKNSLGESYIINGKSSGNNNVCPSPSGLYGQKWTYEIDQQVEVLEGVNAIAIIQDGNNYWSFVRVGKSTP